MAVTHSANDLKVGLKILLDSKPCVILESEFVKPGKGQAFTRIRYRELLSTKVLEKTLKSSDKVGGADVMELDVNFMYSDGTSAHFMDPNSYEQYSVALESIVDEVQWLTEQTPCILTLFNGEPMSIEPPNFIEAVVKETDPGLKGDTATGGSKPATLDGGAVVQVPLFVEQGEVVRVDTRKKEYVGRAKG